MTMNRKILVDTSALIAYFIKFERNHNSINNYLEENPDHEWIIPSTVFSELMTWFRIKVNPSKAVPIGTFLREECTYHHLTRSEDEETWNIYRKYTDKGWSYTDCSLLSLSKKMNVPYILTLDHHFKQMKQNGVLVVPE